MWRCTSTVPRDFVVWYVAELKHRNSCTFTFVVALNLMYEGNSISKLQIVI